MLRLERTLHGPNAGEALPGRLVIKLVLSKGVAFATGGQVFNQSSLDDPVWKQYIRDDIDFVPEQPYLDKLVALAGLLDTNQQ